jgi:hypothetical protein
MKNDKIKLLVRFFGSEDALVYMREDVDYLIIRTKDEIVGVVKEDVKRYGYFAIVEKKNYIIPQFYS